jgi:hypothetical protein
VDGRQRDPVLGQSTACQEALVRESTREERPRRPGRLAIIPVACSDGQPWTWSWSHCCLRPEDAGTCRGGEQASRNIGCRYRVDTFCVLNSAEGRTLLQSWIARGQREPQIATNRQLANRSKSANDLCRSCSVGTECSEHVLAILPRNSGTWR